MNLRVRHRAHIFDISVALEYRIDLLVLFVGINLQHILRIDFPKSVANIVQGIIASHTDVSEVSNNRAIFVNYAERFTLNRRSQINRFAIQSKFRIILIPNLVADVNCAARPCQNLINQFFISRFIKVIDWIQRFLHIEIVVITNAGDNRDVIPLGDIHCNLRDKIVIRKSQKYTFRFEVVEPII